MSAFFPTSSPAPSPPADLEPQTTLGRFFFSQEVPYGLAMARFSLLLVLFIERVPRWWHARELYSTDGATTPLSVGYGFCSILPEFGPEVVVFLHTAMLICMLTGAVGWCTRLSLIIATSLYFYIGMLDALGTLTKYSVIATHILVLLTLSRCGSVWSVDAWLARRGRPLGAPWTPHLGRARYDVWPQRLSQIMIGVVYFGAAITKIHTPAFFTGDQMQYWMMTYINSAHTLGDYLTLFPSIIVMCGYVSIVWEMLFLFCSWNTWMRPLMLAMGVLFHLMTWLTLGLTLFPLIMYAIYFSFLTEAEVQWLARLGRRTLRLLPRAFRRMTAWRLPAVSLPQVRPAVSLAVLLAVVGTLSGAGIFAERWCDPYGTRRPEGPYTLKTLSPERVEQMLGPQPQLRDKDRLLAFEIGKTLVAGHLWHHQANYQHGDSVICVASLNPPHPDMVLECNLHDDRNRVLNRIGQPVPREMYRAYFTYLLPESLEPGEYQLVLRTRGSELARRKFTVAARTVASAQAN